MMNIQSKTHDHVHFMEYLHQVADKRKLVIKHLGKIRDDSLIMLIPEKINNGPKLLVAAGFHGDEPAGSWGVLSFIDEYFDQFSNDVNIAFLPLVNPTGFRNRTRVNDWKENPNSGFCHTSSGKPEPSHEGKILIDHIAELKLLARNGFISLHEDFEQDRFYLYTFEQATNPGNFSNALRSELIKFFDQVPDGIVEGTNVNRGIVFRACDGSFEDFLFHEGIPCTASTETPGLLDINKRIAANVSLIKGLIEFNVLLN